MAYNPGVHNVKCAIRLGVCTRERERERDTHTDRDRERERGWEENFAHD